VGGARGPQNAPVGGAQPSAERASRRGGPSDGLPAVRSSAQMWDDRGRSTHPVTIKETPMSKRGRKRKARKRATANHGKRPNS